jgi:hypothetical protein
VTCAYVQACDGDVARWQDRWRATRAELGWPVEAFQQADPVIPPAGEGLGVPRKGRVLTRNALIAAGSVAAAVIAVALTWPGGHAIISASGTEGDRGLTAQQGARFAGIHEPVADNTDPVKAGCATDPALTALDSVDVETSAENLLGAVQLRFSPRCRAAWGRFVPSTRMTYFGNASVTIIASRPGTHTAGTPYRVRFDGQDAYGNILMARPGCIQVAVTIQAPTGGGTESTRCER